MLILTGSWEARGRRRWTQSLSHRGCFGRLNVGSFLPDAIMLLLVAAGLSHACTHVCSYVIRWAEMYILWQELKTEMAHSGSGEERPLHDVFRTKTARRQMVS